MLTKAVQLTNISERTFAINEIQLPELLEDQIAIQVITTTIDTLDYKKILGVVPNLPLPFTPGLEVYGKVIATGSNAENLLNKHVAAWTFDGAVKSIAISNLRRSISFPENIDSLQASMGFINPLTVLGLLEFHKGESAIINNGANSAVGRILSKVCKFKGIKLINIVRSQENLEKLKSEGDQYVLNSSDESFFKDLQDLSASLNANLFLDSIAGDLSGQILKVLPSGSKMVDYGNISCLPIGQIDASDLRWKKKSIEGFFIPEWILSVSEEVAEEKKKFVVENYEKLFYVNIAGVYSPEQYKEAFNEYAKNTSGGKRVIKF